MTTTTVVPVSVVPDKPQGKLPPMCFGPSGCKYRIELAGGTRCLLVTEEWCFCKGDAKRVFEAAES